MKNKSSSARRSRLDILYQILVLCRKPQQKTWIMFECNLNHELLRKCLNFLVESNLLKILREDNKKYYQTTENGEKFISEYDRMKKVLNEAARRRELSGRNHGVQ
ncbi:MAG: winged helix-turn-helix domain-containing protein [Candidatus Bathyarchaeia archaeon]